ncbi:MAG: hypothetical protein QXJ51_00210 [Sulfolobales archaeon]
MKRISKKSMMLKRRRELASRRMHRSFEKLLELRSREASLRFKLSRLFEEAKVETIRLSGMVAFCRTTDDAYEDLHKVLSEMLAKYLGFEKR